MKRKKTKKSYALRKGMFLEKRFYGQLHRLEVLEERGCFSFKLGNKTFSSLTQAARYVCGDETRAISGPQFWNAPLV